MYTTQSKRQIERQFIERRRRQLQIDVYNIEQQIDRVIVRQSDSQIERRGWQLQIYVYNIEQQIDREIVRQRGGGCSYRQMYTTQNNRSRDTQIERRRRQVHIDVYKLEQQEEVGTDRCIQHRTIDKQKDSQIERRRRRRRYRQMYTTQNKKQIERY